MYIRSWEGSAKRLVGRIGLGSFRFSGVNLFVSTRWMAVLAGVLLMQPQQLIAQGLPWQQITSVENVVEVYPDRMRLLLAALDLDRPGFEQVRTEWQRDDLVSACEALLVYYRNSDLASWLAEPLNPNTVTPELIRQADSILTDIYFGFNISGTVPRTSAGHLDWTHRGPLDDLQFSCQVNRHWHLPILLRAYQATGKVEYLDRLDLDLRDWLIAAGGNAAPEGFGAGQLEAALRMPRWSQVFHALRAAERFQPATRLLLLAAIPEHALYLKQTLRPAHNFATMQMNGLGTIGLAFPEFANAENWYCFAMDRMTEELKLQVYPDGAQKELTSSYHMVALNRFQALMDSSLKAGRPIATEYRAGVELMYEYPALAMRPDGGNPLNNDSDRIQISERVLKAAELFDRPEWLYIATNGREGVAPAGPPSHMFPWAGQLVSRSGWDEDAHWSFFDVGPYGVAHQHKDMLHLSVQAHGRDLLVDSGRFAYQGRIAEKFYKAYALHSRAHNVILVDGHGQRATEREAEIPHFRHSVQPDFDYAHGEYRLGFGPDFLPVAPVRHTRAVLYFRGRGWLVVDRIAGQGEHTISPLWHFHPSVNVHMEGDAVWSADEGQGNLRITTAGEIDWQTSLVRGQEKPTLQGWYSRSYGEFEPATCAVYEGRINQAALFAWVITTARNTPEPVSVEWLAAPVGTARVRIHWPDGDSVLATVMLEEREIVDVGDGRRFIGGALIEIDGRPAQVACGRLMDADGATIIDDSPSVSTAVLLDDLVNRIAPYPAVSDKGSEEEADGFWKAPLVNAYFTSPINIAFEPAPDNSDGWRVDFSPPMAVINPGQGVVFSIRAAIQAREPRYPLPEFIVRAETMPANGLAPLRSSVRLALPLIGARPLLAIGQVSDAGAGFLEAVIPDRAPDVPRLGHMHMKRDVDHVDTAVWAEYDQDALYLTFRCREPYLERMQLEARERDDAVWNDDSVEVFLAAEPDRREYVQLVLNAAGVLYDAKGFDGSFDMDGIRVATGGGDGEWIASLAIPWAALPFEADPPHVAVLFARNRLAGGSHLIYQFPLSPGGNHQPDFFARLRGMALK